MIALSVTRATMRMREITAAMMMVRLKMEAEN